MDIESLLAEHLGPARRELERQRVLFEQMNTAEIVVRSPDQSVSITLTPAGDVREVTIARGTFERHDEQSLGKVLTKALQTGRTVGRQAAEQLTDEVIRQREASGRG